MINYLNNQPQKNKIYEILFSIIYFFRQATQYLAKLKFIKIGSYDTTINSATYGGNLDPFYLFGISNIIKNIKNKKITKESLYLIIPLIIYTFIQVIFIKDINITKTLISLVKIILCIECMIYFKDNQKKINLIYCAKIISIIFFVFTIIALTIGSDTFLWRMKDYVNVYTTTRLQLFYLEPSELGFHIAIIIILLYSQLLKEKTLKNKIIILIYIALDILPLKFASSMGAICILIASLFCMTTFFIFNKTTRKKVIVYAIIIILGIIIIFTSIRLQNPIMERVIDTFNGQDNSNNYRVGVTYKVFIKSLTDYNFLGCGLGNINTEEFINNYSNFKLVIVMVNSFIYFCTETGIFGIIYLLILISMLIRNCIKSKSPLKWGILVFILIYQLFGSHFTNGVIWMIYGLILSSKVCIDEKKLIEGKKDEDCIHY